MARLSSQLLKIIELSAAIAFAKGMNVVDVAENLAGSYGEGGGMQMPEAISFSKAAADIRHAGLDETAELKLVTAFGDFDGAYFSCP
jgi:hypothetical protein